MSHRTVWSASGILLLILLVAAVAMAGPGKVRGRVTDRETGEALVGATVAIDGTSLGATTNQDGDYIILSVPPGIYAVKASYVGYQSVRLDNIRVTVDLTTEANFRLSATPIQQPTVEITVQAPLVDKSSTSEVATVRSERIEELPLRGVGQVFALSGGVVQQGGAYYVRGGRLEETAFYVDGVLVNNPMNGQLTLNVINNAIEEVQSQIGGMTAQYGNGMSGVVNTITKTGGQKYTASLEVITDQLGNSTSKGILGAYSYGQSEYDLTIGGPIIPTDNRFRFFLAGQRVFNRSAATFMDGINMPAYVTPNDVQGADFVVVNRDSVGGVKSQTNLANRTYIANLLNASNYAGGQQLGGINQNSYALNGNIFADFTNFNIKVGGTFNTNKYIGSFTDANNGYVRGLNIVAVTGGDPRGIETQEKDMSFYAKVTHIIDPATYYSVQANYYGFFQKQGDQFWMDNIWAYGNPDLNPVLVGPGVNPNPFSVYGFSGNWPGDIPLNYTKISRENLGGRVDFTHQFGPKWEMLVGGDLTRYTIRTYTIQARDLFLAKQQQPGATDWTLYNTANVGAYGYDIYGNPFSGGSFTDNTGYTVNLPDWGPRHPLFAGAYLQNKFEFEDLILNVGLRYDVINPGFKQYKDLANIQLASLGGVPVVADSSLTHQDISTQLSPRIGFSFPVSDKTVFHATYGKFMQQGQLNDLYDPLTTAARFFAGGYARQFPNPNLKPERTTDYEVGFRQQLGDQSSIDLTFFYKDVRDLDVIRIITPDPGSGTQSWFANVNGDFGTTKGLTLNFQVRRTNRIAVFGTYTLSNSIATGSSSATLFDVAWQDNSGIGGKPYFPVIPANTAFDRTHVGNVNLDYRYDKDDGPTILNAKPLERVGLNVLFSFSSGVRYTFSQVNGIESATNAPRAFEAFNSSSGPWIFSLDAKLDKTVTVLNDVDLNIYLWVTNLLNRQNVEALYAATGLPNDDGWLPTAAGLNYQQTYGAAGTAFYEYLMDAVGNYGPPRQVRLGVRLTM